MLLRAAESPHTGRAAAGSQVHRKDDPRTLSACSSVRSKHQSRGRCCRAVEPAQLTARWEHAYLRLPGEGKEAGGSPAPYYAAATAQAPLRHCFPSEQGGGLHWSPPKHRNPSSPGGMLPSLLCFRCPQASSCAGATTEPQAHNSRARWINSSLAAWGGMCSAWGKGTTCRRPKLDCLQAVGSG